MRKYGLDMSAIALSVCMLLPLLGNTAGDTAFEEVQALTMGGYDPTVAGKVYGIRGKHTSPNPASWTLLLKELNLGLDKKARENTSTVSGGKVFPERTLPLLELEKRDNGIDTFPGYRNFENRSWPCATNHKRSSGKTAGRIASGELQTRKVGWQ